MENSVVNEAIAAAESIDREVKEKVLGDQYSNENFVAINTEYPKIINDGEAPPAKEVVIAKHLEYVDRVSKLMLTHSLFMGLGFEVPTGHALSPMAVDNYLKEQKAQIQYKNVQALDNDANEIWEFEVFLGASRYIFLDTDRWLGGLRALHFLVTRHDPDLTEYVNRKLTKEGGLDDNWLEEIHRPKL